MREIELAKVQKMLNEGAAISAPPTDWETLVVFATKKDGVLRFSVDYRHRDTVIVRNAFSIPRTEECIDSLVEAKVFSMLDVNSSH